MKKILTVIVLLVISQGMLLAYPTKIDGINYTVNERDLTAEVIGEGLTGNAYKGDIKIPQTIKSLNKTYLVTSIGKYAFFKCAGLTNIMLPNSISSIGDYAFQDCSSLTNIELPNSLTNIGISAFSGCAGLKKIEIPNNVKSIGANAFSKCTGLKSIILPNSITSIESAAFANCNNLKSVVIPNTVRFISNDAFSECSALTSVEIPNSVISIGNSVFFNCSELVNVTIPNSVTLIGSYAFCGCSSLNSIEIPDRVRSIEYGTFDGCTSLTNVVIPISVTSIKDGAFQDCNNLTNIVIPQGFDVSKLPSEISRIGESQNVSVKPVVTSTPPNLAIVDGSVVFTDNTQNNRIDANEQCAISFKVQNLGKGAASGCVATVRMTGDKAGVIANNVSLNTIAAGATEEIKIPVSSNIQTTTGQVTFTIEVTEPNGFGADPFELSVNTKAYEPPYLQIVDYAVTGAQGGTLVKKQPFNLQLMLQNTKYGTAENVEVELQLPGNVYLLDGERKVSLATLDGGKAQSLDYQIVVTNNYEGTSIPVNVRLREKYGKYAEDKSMTLQLNQNLASSRLTVKAAEEDLAKQEIQLASIGSAVDKNIPVSKIQNKNTFAVIIANENYQQVASVPFALNDGSVFRQYCEKTLGIPATNIHFVANATGNNIRYEVNWLSQVIRAYNGQAKIIFYYAGHGVPDEQNKTAFLLPVDGNGSDVTTGYKLDDLYNALGNLPSEAVTVFLDACFSGSKRESGMLASARGVAIKVKSGEPVGKMVVFTAATGDETAYPNKAEGHGMFTYYLLKKLQETSGEVSYDELGNYIRQNVSQQSIVLNGKSQTPTIIPSSQAAGWQNWKLK